MNVRIAIVLTLLAALSACSHTGTIPNTAAPESIRSGRATLSGVKTGNFTEYPLPAIMHPAWLTRGPYNTLWFTGSPNTLNYIADGTGVLYSVSIPHPYTTIGGPIAAASNKVWFLANDYTVRSDPQYAGGATWTHAFSFLGIGSNDQISTNLAVGPDRNLWFGQCVNVCGQGAVANSGEIESVPIQPGSQAVTVRLQNFMNAVDITPGPGGNLYATATNFGAFATREDAIYVLSTSGSILDKFDLPANSRPIGIVTGPDHNLWIVEAGTNKIARMTPAGSFTRFSIPTKNSGSQYITYGSDGALWFTETGANKIARITTAGSFTEYPIPTVNSGAFGIVPCTTFCGAHGGVWFAETNDSRIGKFNAPI